MNEIDICNQALVAGGSRTQINSLNDSNTAARTCLLFYESTRDELFRAAQWSFANKFVNLPLITQLPGAPGNTDSGGSEVWLPSYPAPGWLYQYGYPADCAKMNYIIPQGQWGAFLAQAQTWGPWKAFENLSVKFEISSSNDLTVINTNAQQAIGAYTELVTNVSRYSPDFVTALVGFLAKKLVIPLSGDKKLALAAYAESERLVMKAQVTSANESLTVIDNIPDWLQVRDWPEWSGGGPAWWQLGGSV